MLTPTFVALVALTVTPVAGTPVTVAPITINNSAGHQTDPHVDGDVAAYTDFAVGAQIRYYDFGTGADSAIPTDGSRDQLSDISAGRIVFTRIFSDGSEAVMLFDTAAGVGAVPVNPSAGSWRSAVAIGGDTVAYVDHQLAANNAGEVVVWDLAASSATRLTNDEDFDQAPAVSSDGKVVVWEQCPLSMSNCQIAMAVKGNTGWTVSTVAPSGAAQGFPDTNGVNVVWTEHNGTDYDIYWRAVAGGAVQQIELAGDQIHPSVAGDVIAFEGVSGGATDLFIFHVVDGTLYQLTNTPGVQESLNDVAVLADESMRVVWQANDGADGANDIYGATFALAPAANTDPPTDGGVGGGGHCVPGRGRGHWRHGNGHGYGHDKHGHCHGHDGSGGDDDDDDDDDDGDCDDGHGDDDDDGHHGDGHHGGGHHGGGHHGNGNGGHHKRNVEKTGSVRQALTPDEPAPALGCASTGSGAAPFALLAMAMLLALRPKRAEVRRDQR